MQFQKIPAVLSNLQLELLKLAYNSMRLFSLAKY